MSEAYETREVERNGRHYVASFYRDDSTGAPWEEHDGHGPVSDWRRGREKSPGEWEVSEDRGSFRWYDSREALRIAKRDGWGLGPDELAKLENMTGRKPTAGMIAAEAVRLDFERMRAWCNDSWHWCGVTVRPVDEHGEPADEEYAHALWGIESDAGAYFDEVIADLCDEVEHDVQRATNPAATLGT